MYKGAEHTQVFERAMRNIKYAVELKKKNNLNVTGIEQDHDLLKRAKNANYKVLKSIDQIKSNKFDLKGLKNNVDQIWAEAVVLWKSGQESVFLEGEKYIATLSLNCQLISS